MKNQKLILIICLSVIAIALVSVTVAFGVDSLTVDSNGRVGIGTETPQAMLHIRKSSNNWDETIAAGIKLENPSQSAANANIFLSEIYGIDLLRFFMNGNDILTLNALGDGSLGGDLILTSDINLKKDVEDLDNSLEKITKIRGVSYKWKDKDNKGDKTHIGLVAQEVEKVFPEAVSDDYRGNKGISYSSLVAPLIEAVKELKAENDELKKGYADLLARVEALEKKNKPE